MSTRRKIVAFNLQRVHGLLNSAAYAEATRRNTRLSVKPFFGSVVHPLNAAAMLFTGGRSGISEIDHNARDVERDREIIYAQLWDGAKDAIGRGPVAFVNYLKSVERDRDDNLQWIRNGFNYIQNANRETSQDLRRAVEVLAGIQLVSTIVVAVSPVGLTLLGASASTAASAGMVGFGYSITKDLVKGLGQVDRAGIIAFEDTAAAVGKTSLKEASNKAADFVADKARERIEGQQVQIEYARERINQLTQEIRNKVSSRKIAKLSRKIDRSSDAMITAEHMVKKATFVKYGARALQVVFAAHDVIEAWEDYEKVWNDK